MIRLGVNSVLFKAVSFPEAARAIKMAGYDGVEISAIKGMCEHLNLERYAEQKNEIKEVLAETGLELLASEVASTDADRLELAFTVAADLFILFINVGPGGKMNEPGSLEETIDRLAGGGAGTGLRVTLCWQGAVGAAMFNTTTLKAMAAIANSASASTWIPATFTGPERTRSWRSRRCWPARATSTSETAAGAARLRANRRCRPAAAAISTCSPTARPWSTANMTVRSTWRSSARSSLLPKLSSSRRKVTVTLTLA